MNQAALGRVQLGYVRRTEPIRYEIAVVGGMFKLADRSIFDRYDIIQAGGSRKRIDAVRPAC